MNNNKEKIIFSAKSEDTLKLYNNTRSHGYVSIPADTALRTTFNELVAKFNLNPYSVLRKLLTVYLRIRKINEDPHKGMRAMLRKWISRAQGGNISGFDNCALNTFVGSAT